MKAFLKRVLRVRTSSRLPAPAPGVNLMSTSNAHLSLTNALNLSAVFTENPPLKSEKNLEFTLTYAPGLQDSAPRGGFVIQILVQVQDRVQCFYPVTRALHGSRFFRFLGFFNYSRVRNRFKLWTQ